MGYTWHQFTAYLRLARRRAARQRIERMTDLAVAVNGGGADLVRALAQAAEQD